MKSRIHRFSSPVEGVALPERFTFPFCYEPHPLCLLAAHEVRDYIDTCSDLRPALASGKMLGVLVVRDDGGELGFLAAFSGNLDGVNDHEYFVPPVYDLLAPDGEFRRGEAEIDGINAAIAHIESSEGYHRKIAEFEALKAECDHSVTAAREALAASRALREKMRSSDPLSDSQNAALIAQSQREKAEFKRLKRRWEVRLAEADVAVERYRQNIAALRTERHRKSEALQRRIFSLFVVRNAIGESADLLTVFSRYYDTPEALPPAGTGECCAPKLLQYAYCHGYIPLCMAEFWVGASPDGEVRREGDYYPACSGKCRPLLAYMLQGLDVDPDPHYAIHAEPVVVYEDESLIAVDKPSGMLTVAGKVSEVSAESWVRRRCEIAADVPVTVHRLDADTSGLVLFARTKPAHEALQRQFAEHSARKTYLALLDGDVVADEGEIRLPLRPDIDDRPRQRVDFEHGKTAVTHYRVLRREGGRTLVEFEPLTGRTHQLRVHAAHHLGLGAPIVGDRLYGTAATRLMLHAARLTITHPDTGEPLTIEASIAW